MSVLLASLLLLAAFAVVAVSVSAAANKNSALGRHQHGLFLNRLTLSTPEDLRAAVGVATRCAGGGSGTLSGTLGCAFDVWSGDSRLILGRQNDVVLDAKAEQLLLARGVRSQRLFGLEAAVEAHLMQVRRARMQAFGNSSYYATFRTYEEIVKHVNGIAEEFPKVVTVRASVGKSVEGRNLPAVVLSGAAQGKTAAKKPAVYFQGMQHAREWISPATVVYIIEEMAKAYGKDSVVTQILDTVELHVLPVVNPDGYEYTFSTNRLWRKNRRDNGKGIFGVDLNRNWDNHWCETGASSNPSSDTYCGSGPFSEPESKAASDYIKALQAAGQKVVAAIDWHAYGQLILRPYGWTTQPSPSEAPLKAIGAELQAAIRNVHGKFYENIRGAELYPASGGADDWFYGQAGIVDSYTIELRDTGRYGFLLPPSEIIPTAQENFEGMRVFLARVISAV